MANKTKATPQEEEAREQGPEIPDAPLSLLDLSDAAIKQATKRGYVTYEQFNAIMPSEEVTPQQIEEALATFNERGINVVETEEAEADEEEETREKRESEETESSELVEVTPKTPAKSEAMEPIERTDDPVRMYLREMGSIGLLSRQGEVAIAKRIEAGREAMIAGLCDFAASASLYGVGIVTNAEDSPHLLIDRIKGEMYFGFAETDEHVPANVIPTLKSGLDKAGSRYGLDVFPNSRHGFQFPERDVYETHAAEESWSKVVATWDRNLKIADVGRMTAS